MVFKYLSVIDYASALNNEYSGVKYITCPVSGNHHSDELEIIIPAMEITNTLP